MARKKTTSSEANGVLATDLAATRFATTPGDLVADQAVAGKAVAGKAVAGKAVATDVVVAETKLPVTRAGAQHATKKPQKAASPKAPKSKGRTAKAPKADTPTINEEAAKPRKLSALNAAAKVLEDAGQPMNCQEMIAAMAAKGYWTSPAGKTPAATLYSAVLREIKTKAGQARFQKAARGQFVYQTPKAS